MDEAEINRRLLQNASIKRRREQNSKSDSQNEKAPRNTRMKGLNCKTRFKFEQSRGEKPSTKETYVFKEAMFDAVKAANHSSYVDKKNQIPKRFLELLVLA